GELKADYVFDIATLAVDIVIALVTRVGGILGNEELLDEMIQVGDKNGDRVFPLSLIEDYESSLESDYADISSISNRPYAGSITAGLFIRKFVNDSAKWIHVDKAGRIDGKDKGYYAKGAPGIGASHLADYTEHVSK